MEKEPLIYLIVGKARSGKSTVSDIIKNKYDKSCQLLISFYIKQYAINYFGWNGNDNEKPRDLLQKLGRQIIIDELNMEDFLINRTLEDIKILNYFFDVFAIGDVRYLNEINKIKSSYKKVVVIKIERPNFNNGLTFEQQNHITEIALDDYKDYDYKIINDGSYKDLKTGVLKIIEDVNRRYL